MRGKLFSRQSWLVRYGAALVAVDHCLADTHGADRAGRPGLPTYITFYPAVMTVALLAGFGPGLLATAAAALMVDYWLLLPLGFGIDKPADAVGLALFAGMGVFMSVIAALYRRALQEGGGT